MPLRNADREIQWARLTRAASYWLCLVLLIAQGCSFGGPSGRQRSGIFHPVKPGENLFRIGKAYDINYKELARINGISDPNRIRAGQRLFIPGATRVLPVEIITPASAVVRLPRGGEIRRDRRRGFIWPVRGRVTSGFGRRSNSFHDGVDISAPSGTPIRAAHAGRVIYSDELRGYGNLIIIRHTDGYASVYAHNRRNLAREGQRIAKGQIIGEVGSTGRVSGPHLHFEIRRNNVAVDPLYYLP